MRTVINVRVFMMLASTLTCVGCGSTVETVFDACSRGALQKVTLADEHKVSATLKGSYQAVAGEAHGSSEGAEQLGVELAKLSDQNTACNITRELVLCFSQNGQEALAAKYQPSYDKACGLNQPKSALDGVGPSPAGNAEQDKQQIPK